MKKEYEIDKWNQYGLKEPRHGTKNKSKCPFCSDNRRDKNDLCASLDWEAGRGTCHHCGKRFKLHTWKLVKPKTWYAYKELPTGKTRYFNDDGTTTDR